MAIQSPKAGRVLLAILALALLIVIGGWSSVTVGSEPASPEQTGSISGHVYEEGGVTPIANARVEIDIYSQNDTIADTQTDAQGFYQVDGLEPRDDYKVEVSASSYLRAFYPQQARWTDAVPVTVLADQTTSDVDVHLLKADSYITGSVTYAGGAPAANVWIEAFHDDGWFVGVHADASGNYQSPVISGTWWLFPHDPPNVAEGRSVSVSSGQTIPNIDFVLYPGGTVSGTVVAQSDGSPLAHITVGVERTSDHRWWYDCTDDQGRYQVRDINYGDYKVWAGGDTRCGGDQTYMREYWQEKTNWDDADMVTISAASPDITGIDFTLARGGSISGHVYEEGGVTPIANARVEIDIYSQNDTIADAQTDAQGFYQVDGLEPRDDYKVEVSASGYLRAFYPQQARWSDAVPVTVLAGQTTSDVDVHLLKADSYITGSVTYEGGAPAANVWLEAFHDDGWFVGVHADANGNYQSPVISGTWWVFPHDPPNVAEERSVSVSSGQTVPNIDFVLYPGGTVSGTVVAQSDGSPLAHITVGVERTSDHRWWYDCTDDQGRYQVRDIHHGDYKVWAAGDSRCGGDQTYMREYWQEKTNWDDADMVTISAASPDITGIDFTLAQGGSISGHVYEEDGATPVADACVAVSSTAPEWTPVTGFCCTDIAGSYAISSLPVGSIYVRTFADCWGTRPDLQDEWYSSAGSTPDGSQAGAISIQAAQTITGVDFALDLASSATVLPDDGGTLSSTIGVTTTMSFPPGAASEPFTVTLKIIVGQPISSGLRFLGQSFSIEAATADGTSVTTFAEPFTITLEYDDTDVEGIDEATLKLHYWNPTSGQWQEIPAEVDFDTKAITAVLDHLTEFAVIGESQYLIYLPATLRNY